MTKENPSVEEYFEKFDKLKWTVTLTRVNQPFETTPHYTITAFKYVEYADDKYEDIYLQCCEYTNDVEEEIEFYTLAGALSYMYEKCLDEEESIEFKKKYTELPKLNNLCNWINYFHYIMRF